MASEKISTYNDTHADPEQLKPGDISDDNEALEVFQRDGEVNFRNVGWIRCTTIFLKIIFSTGVLGIPVAISQLGAVGGALSLVGWSALNTYNGTVSYVRKRRRYRTDLSAQVQGNFRNRHRGCHSIADMAERVGGVVLKEIVGL